MEGAIASLIGALRATLSAETASFEQGMSRARRSAAAAESSIKRSLSGINGALTGLAAGLSIGAMVAVTNRALQYAASLGEVSQQLGVTTRDLQIFRYAASQMGVTQEEADKGLARLTLSLSKAAAGSKPTIAAFQAVGISLQDIKNKGAVEIFGKMADSMNKTGGASANAAAGAALMGKSFQKFVPLANGGSAALNELARAAEEMGLVLSDDQIQRADETADKLDALKQVLEARIAGIVADNASSIMGLATSFANLAAGIARFWASNPERALGLLGAAGGAMVGGRFGPWGAVIGGVAGGVAGYNAGGGSSADAIKSMEMQRAKTRAWLAKEIKRRGGGKGNAAQDLAILRQKDPAMRGTVRSLQMTEQGLRKLRGDAGLSGSIAAPSVPSGPLDVPNFLGGGGGAGKRTPRGKSAEQLAAEAERERKEAVRSAYDAASDIRNSEMDEIRARRDLVFGINERARFEEQLLVKQHEADAARIEYDLAMGEINEAQAQKRRAHLEILKGLELEKLKQDEAYEIQQEVLRHDRASAESALELMEMDASLAETAAERRKVELEIVKARYRQLWQAQQDIIDDARSSAEEKNMAARRQIDLEKMQGSAEKQVRRGTMGPMESFINSLPTTAAKADEALEAVAANGLQSLTDGLTDAIMGAKSLGEVFSNVSKQIIADLVRIAVQRAIVAPLANAMFGEMQGAPSSSGGLVQGATSQGGGWLGSILGAAGAAASIFGGGRTMGALSGPGAATGMARGGAFKILGNRGVDTNLLSINGRPVARVSHGEMATISPNNDNGRQNMTRVIVDTSPLLTHRIVQGDQMAAAGGSAGAISKLTRRQTRTLP